MEHKQTKLVLHWKHVCLEEFGLLGGKLKLPVTFGYITRSIRQRSTSPPGWCQGTDRRHGPSTKRCRQIYLPKRQKCSNMFPTPPNKRKNYIPSGKPTWQCNVDLLKMHFLQYQIWGFSNVMLVFRHVTCPLKKDNFKGNEMEISKNLQTINFQGTCKFSGWIVRWHGIWFFKLKRCNFPFIQGKHQIVKQKVSASVCSLATQTLFAVWWKHLLKKIHVDGMYRSKRVQIPA